MLGVALLFKVLEGISRLMLSVALLFKVLEGISRLMLGVTGYLKYWRE